MGFTWDKGNVLRARLRNLNLRLITDLTTYFISSALEALAAASAMSSPILLAGVAIAALEGRRCGLERGCYETPFGQHSQTFAVLRVDKI